jgi:hypothetical protein
MPGFFGGVTALFQAAGSRLAFVRNVPAPLTSLVILSALADDHRGKNVTS